MLDLAPAAISMQISSLEKELNGALFNRSSRLMTLTRHGEFIYQRAPEIIFNIEKLEKNAWQYVNSKSITLTLGFVRSVIFNLIPEMIKYFADTHGHIEINLKEVLSEYQPELLLKHELDIGFTRKMDNNNFIGHELNYELILIDPLIAAIPKSGYSLRVFEKFDEYGIRPAVSHRVVEIYTALALVGAGLGVTLVGKTTIPNNRQDIIFLPIEDFRCLSYIYAVYNPKNTNLNIHAFIDTMKKVAE